MDIAEFTEAAKEDPRLQLGVTHMYYCGTQKVVSISSSAIAAAEELRRARAGQKTE